MSAEGWTLLILGVCGFWFSLIVLHIIFIGDKNGQDYQQQLWSERMQREKPYG